MLYHLFSVHDSAADSFGNLITQPTRAMALRVFTEIANDPASDLYKHAPDMTLFELGTYNVQTGVVTPLPAPDSIANALLVIRQKPDIMGSNTPLPPSPKSKTNGMSEQMKDHHLILEKDQS